MPVAAGTSPISLPQSSSGRFEVITVDREHLSRIAILACDRTILGHHKCVYDAWNRLVKVQTDASTPADIGVMTYDGLGRRIKKVITNSGDWNCTYHFYYNGQRMIETRNGSDDVLKQHVWGQTYVDELVQVALNGDPSVDNDCLDGDSDASYYAAQDANFNVTKLFESDGDLAERYAYTPYGQRQVYKPADGSDTFGTEPIAHTQPWVISSEDQPYGLCDVGHQGLLHDKEFGLLHNRARSLHPRLGRWMSRDFEGYLDGMSLYEYARTRPSVLVDPRGLSPIYPSSDAHGTAIDPPAPDPIPPILEEAIFAAIQEDLAYQWPPRAPNLSLIQAVMRDRWADRRARRLAPEPRHVHTGRAMVDQAKYRCCDDRQIRQIQDTLAGVSKALLSAHQFLSALYKGRSVRTTVNAYGAHIAPPPGTPSGQKGKRAQVFLNYFNKGNRFHHRAHGRSYGYTLVSGDVRFMAAAKKIDDLLVAILAGTIYRGQQFECRKSHQYPCNEGKYGWEDGGTVGLCPTFFGPNSKRRVVRLLHELSHAWADTSDERPPRVLGITPPYFDPDKLAPDVPRYVGQDGIYVSKSTGRVWIDREGQGPWMTYEEAMDSYRPNNPMAHADTIAHYITWFYDR